GRTRETRRPFHFRSAEGTGDRARTATEGTRFGLARRNGAGPPRSGRTRRPAGAFDRRSAPRQPAFATAHRRRGRTHLGGEGRYDVRAPFGPSALRFTSEVPRGARSCVFG